MFSPAEEKQRKVKPAAKPKPVKQVKVEDDDQEWTEVSSGARPQVSLFLTWHLNSLPETRKSVSNLYFTVKSQV